MTVPIASLVPAGDGYQLFIVAAGDTARARPVIVGRRTGAIAEIVSGVELGETVITEGAYGVEDGTPIRRITSAVRDASGGLRERTRRDTAPRQP